LEKLDYLKDLGVDALWITPVFPSPWKDSGYDVADYDGVHPSMGTMADLRTLIREAHRRKLRIILDLVINHTSDQHAWFQASRSSRNHPKRDFYIWRAPRDGAEPNNWKSLVRGSVWEWDQSSGEYYLHLFSKHQPDLNWRNPQVKQAVFEMMRGWLAEGVDGFRMDVINCLIKPTGLPDARRVSGDDDPYVLDRSLYADNPGMHELIHEMRSEVLEPHQACAIGEVHFNTKEMAALYVDPPRKELDLIFQTDLLFDRTGPASIGKSIAAWDEVLHGRGWNGFCLGNHDTPRQVSALGDDGLYRSESAKALATLTLTAPGSPFIFQGDELGMTNVSFQSLDDYRDIEMKSFYAADVEAGADPVDTLNLLRPKSRDNSRTPMQWSGKPNAGFTTGTPWIGVNSNYSEINAEAQAAAPDSVLQFYRRLLAFRRDHPCLALGDYLRIPDDHPSLLAYKRILPEESLLILINLSSDSVSLRPELRAGEQCLVGNYPEPDPERLRPWEARVLAC
jgi:oligo-1,6-glucosidase